MSRLSYLSRMYYTGTFYAAAAYATADSYNPLVSLDRRRWAKWLAYRLPDGCSGLVSLVPRWLPRHFEPRRSLEPSDLPAMLPTVGVEWSVRDGVGCLRRDPIGPVLDRFAAAMGHRRPGRWWTMSVQNESMLLDTWDEEQLMRASSSSGMPALEFRRSQYRMLEEWVLTHPPPNMERLPSDAIVRLKLQFPSLTYRIDDRAAASADFNGMAADPRSEERNSPSVPAWDEIEASCGEVFDASSTVEIREWRTMRLGRGMKILWEMANRRLTVDPDLAREYVLVSPGRWRCRRLAAHVLAAVGAAIISSPRGAMLYPTEDRVMVGETADLEWIEERWRSQRRAFKCMLAEQWAGSAKLAELMLEPRYVSVDSLGSEIEPYLLNCGAWDEVASRRPYLQVALIPSFQFTCTSRLEGPFFQPTISPIFHPH